MTIQEAFTLKNGYYVHSLTKKNADGTPMRARLTSIKTWKTRPNEIELHYKRGLYEYGTIRESELSEFGVGYGE